MNIMITGGAGYLGCVLTEYLLDQKHDVIILDRLAYETSEQTEFLKDLSEHIYPEDVRNTDYIAKIIDREHIETVIHLAALVGEPLCDKHPQEAREVNVEATKNLALLTKKMGTSLIFASTCSNYGVANLADETSELKPLGLYAETKVEAEKVVLKTPRTIILRFGTLFGYSSRMRLDIIPNEWVHDALSSKKIEVYAPQAWRPILHIKDATRSIELALSLIQEESTIFNVCLGNFTKEYMAETIRSTLPETIIKIVPKGDKRNYKVSTQRIKQKGFTPKTSIQEGIKELIEKIPLLKSDHEAYTNLSYRSCHHD